MPISGLTPYYDWPSENIASYAEHCHQTLCGNHKYAWIDPRNGLLRLVRVTPLNSLIALHMLFVADPPLVRKMYTYDKKAGCDELVRHKFDPPIPLHEAMQIAETFVLMGFFDGNDTAGA